MTESSMERFQNTREVSELPLSVWLSRGWEKEVVLAQENEWSAEYGCQIYKVPIRTLSWSEAFEKEESKLVERERQAQQKRGPRNAQDGLDVPEANTDKDAGKAAKAEKNAVQKTITANRKIAATAAKALGPLQGASDSVAKALETATKHGHAVPEAVLTRARETEKNLADWKLCAREAVNRQECQKNDEQPADLPALPFNSADVKMKVIRQPKRP